MDFIKVTISNTIGGTYTAFAEEDYPPWKKGEAVRVLSARQVQLAEDLAVKSKSKSMYLLKPRKPTEKALEKLESHTCVSINWLDGRITIKDLLDENKPVTKLVSVKQEDDMDLKKNDKLMYSLILADGNTLKNVAKSIFDYYKLPIEFNKIRHI